MGTPDREELIGMKQSTVEYLFGVSLSAGPLFPDNGVEE